MKVKLRTLIAGPAGVIQPDSILDLSDADAAALIRAGSAVAIREPSQGEAAAPAKRERAVANRRPNEKADAPE